jgi:peptidylamidoglycolate lyase
MARVSLLLVIFSCVFGIDGRALESILSSSSESNEHLTSYRVVSNKVLHLVSTDEDAQHDIALGQVGGLAACVKNPNRLLVFQRGSRQWTAESFPDGRHFNKEKFGVIPENTMFTVNTRNGQVVDQWGNDTFYMPHGLSVDSEGNLWATDVAMHQVFKYDTTRPRRQLVLTLGEAFVPGSDSSHFCKPTDVAVSNDGSHIFVADGYCNERIVKFNKKGEFVREYKMAEHQQPLVVPHSLLLIEELDFVCVADRENGRIVCFDAGLDESTKNDEGEVKAIIEHPSMHTVYAITLDANKERLYAVSGGAAGSRALGYTFSVNPDSFGDLIATWKPHDNFGEPHDLAVSVNGRTLFVGEIRPNRIDTFDVVN